MINPFILPESDRDTHGSLCPWQVEEHLHYYVPVDNTEVAFQSFQVELLSWRQNLRRTVLIYGDDGCGKTALANRCAHAVLKRFEADKSRLEIVRLPSANGAVARTAEEKVLHSLRAVVDHFAFMPDFFEANELQNIRDADPDAIRVAQRLEATLAQKQRTLVLIQPGLEIPLDLDVFIERFNRRNVMLILETPMRSVDDHSRMAYGAGAANPIIRLAVGRLNENDCINYVRKRLGMLSTAKSDHPIVDISDLIIRQFTSARTKRTDGLSIREFERVCAHVFELAAKRPDGKVLFEDIAEFYFYNARI